MEIIGISIGSFVVFFVLFSILQAVGQSANTKECPECKMRVPKDAQRCAHCRAWLGEGHDPRPGSQAGPQAGQDTKQQLR